MPTYDDQSSSPLSQTNYFVTTHDAEGKAVFHQNPAGSDEVRMKRMGIAGFSVLYTTDSYPTDLENNKDLEKHFNYKGAVPIGIPNGSVIRFVDVAPGGVSPMHRTRTLDYGVVLHGEVELVLEDLEKGPVRLMKRGDVSIQRATMHAWRNPSKTEWSRMLYVILDAKDYALKAHSEHLDGMELPSQ